MTPNLRDLGGITTESGAAVQPGRLLRSGMPSDLDATPSDIVWPPTLVVDLRSAAEIARHPTLSSVPAKHIPLLSRLAPDALGDGSLAALYLAVIDAAPEALIDVVRAIADSSGAVLVHCAAGKDRTGIAIALVLRLIGVSRSAVVADYAATREHLGAIDAKFRSIMGDQVRGQFPSAYFDVAPEALELVLDIWDQHPGGVRGWLVDAGADADLIGRLQRSLLVESEWRPDPAATAAQSPSLQS